MKIISTFLLFTALLPIALFAQVNLNAPIPVDPNVRIGKLANGFTYYIRRNTKPEKKAEFRLAVNAGSVLERDDQQGYAHFLEHMAFNGTKNFKKNELVSYLQSIGVDFGAHLNAYTSFEETVYELSIPTEKPEALEKGLLVMQDWASSITLDPEEVKKEQGVVLEELRVRQSADRRIFDKYSPNLYYGSPYPNRLPIGKKELLENVNYRALVDFYEEWYRPDLMALIIVGDINVDEIEAKIKANFSGIKAKRPIKPRPITKFANHTNTLVTVATDKEATLSTTRFVFKKPLFEEKTQADLRQTLVRQFYDGMLNARLDEIRQSPNPPFVGASVEFNQLTRNKSSYSVLGFTNPESVTQSLTTLLIENKRVKDFGFTSAEFERQKVRYLTMLENRFKEKDKTESGVLVDNYVEHFLSASQIAGIEFMYQFGKAITPTITLNEINALAKNIMTEDNRVIIVTGPEKEGLKYPTEAEILGLVKQSEVAKVTPYTEKVMTEPLVGNLPANAKITEEKTDTKLGLTYWTLSNGVKVILKSTDFKADEVLMRAFSPGGTSLLSLEKACHRTMFSPVVNQSGVKKMSKVELDKMLAGKRANASISVGEHFEYVNGFSNPKDFETMLQLTFLKFTDINFDKNVFDSSLTRQKMFLQSLKANPRNYFLLETIKTLNQGNPGFCDGFDLQKLDKTTLEDIKSLYQDRFADASDFTFVFVGNIEKEKAKPLLEKYLGNLPVAYRKENWKDTSFKLPFEKIEKVFKKGVDDKSLVDIKFTGDAEFNDDDNRNLDALAELLSIKLIENLREEKGGVYGAGASGGMSKIPKGGFEFTISFPCAPQNVETLIKAAMEEVAKIQNGQIEEKDINKVKEAQLVRIREQIKQNSFWMELIGNFVTEGTQMFALEEIEAKINSLNKADIQKVAQKYLKPEQKKQFVLMPEDKK